MADHILYLQRTVGNHAVGAFLHRQAAAATAEQHAPAATLHAPAPAARQAQAAKGTAIQRMFDWDGVKFWLQFGKSKKTSFQTLVQFLNDYQKLITANKAVVGKQKKFVGGNKNYHTKLERVRSLQMIEQECTNLLVVLTTQSKKHFKQRVAAKNLLYAVQAEIGQLVGPGQAPAAAPPAQAALGAAVAPSATTAAPPGAATVAIATGKQRLMAEIGLPESYLDELGKKSVDLLITVHDALGSGSLVAADVALGTLRATHGGAIDLIKGFMLRRHIGQVDPELAKAMGNAAHREKDAGTIIAGANKVEKEVQAQGELWQILPLVEKVDALPEFAHLSYPEKFALSGYSTQAFTAFNKPLRNDLGTDKFGDEQRSVTALTIGSLNALKPHAGTVFRHGGIFPGYKELNRPGGTVTDMAFVSSAKEHSGVVGGQSHHVLEILTSKTGRDMSAFSLHDNEKEVLFKPGTQFKVLARFDRDLNDKSPDPWLPAAGPYRDMALSNFANDPLPANIQIIVIKEEV